jgi:hypothetical protein
MLGYIEKIHQLFITQYRFPENPSKPGLPVGVPDGQYPMVIDGKLDFVRVIMGKISCCNFEASVGELRQQSAFQDSQTPVVILSKNEELNDFLKGRRIVAVMCYPDSTDSHGYFHRSFKIEVELEGQTNN